MIKLLTNVLPWIPVTGAAVILLSTYFQRSPKYFRRVVLLASIQIGTYLYSEGINYYGGRRNPLQKYLYPPYSYNFLSDSLHHLTPLLSGLITAGLIGLFLYVIFLRGREERFISRRDFWLIVIGVLSVGWPSVLVFLAYIFIFSVVGMVVLVIARKKTAQDRIVITHFIVPAALLTLLTGRAVLILTHLYSIRF